jgi:hypothetical protein
MKVRSWPVIAGVAINPALDDAGDIAVSANLEPSLNFPSARVWLFETPGSAPLDEDDESAPRVACGLTARQARELARCLLDAADAVTRACPDHDKET